MRKYKNIPFIFGILISFVIFYVSIQLNDFLFYMFGMTIFGASGGILLNSIIHKNDE